MTHDALCHKGNRTLHARFADGDRALIERAAMFFLATADAAVADLLEQQQANPCRVRAHRKQVTPSPGSSTISATSSSGRG